MNNRSVIICSESGIDGKDKRAMNEERSSNGCTPLPISTTEVQVDPKTLADLIKNSQTFLANNPGSVATISNGDFAIDTTPFCNMSQVLRQEWVIPNSKVLEEILSGNKNEYIFICCSLSGSDVTHLVLCDVVKNSYSDCSYRIVYNPVSHHKLNRMPE